MRVLFEIPYPAYKVTVFDWNGKFIVKIEQGMLEQTYKVSALDLLGEEDIKKLLDGEFLEGVQKRFSEMNSALFEAVERL
jgi:hypothetical protein